MNAFEYGDVTVVRAVLQHPENTDWVLLLQRSPEASNNPGQWELPGGKLDPIIVDGVVAGHEDPIAGTEREVQEETGFSIKIANYALSRITRYEIPDGQRRGQLYIAYAGLGRIVGGNPIDMENLSNHNEHVGALWADRHNLTRLSLVVTEPTGLAIDLFNRGQLGTVDLA